MNENILRAQVASRQMKLLVEALQDLCERLPRNPKLYAFMAEAPLDHIGRMVNELDQYLEPLKRVPPATSATTLPSDATSTPASPGPIESTS